MTLLALLSHGLFGATLFFCSCGVCWYLTNHPIVLDVPNDRSSHDMPVPISGGIAIVATFLVGIVAVYLIADRVLIGGSYFLGFVASSFLISLVSLIDDLIATRAFFRLSAQVLCVIAMMAFGIVMREFTFPWIGKIELGVLGYILTLFWIVGMANAYNFMDGINGIAAGTAVIVCIFFSYICFLQGSLFTYIIGYTIAAGSLGFLLFNFPKAKLFMGDVGATFLGFVFATISIIAANFDSLHTSLLVMPLLLFHFIYDTLFTFIRRLLNGEHVFQAHRSHLYQLFNRLGYSQTVVSCFYFGMGIVQGIGSLWMVNIPGNNRVFVFIPYLIVQVVYSAIIMKKARKAGLLN
jgi:UDP-GlcNAc:undecaprenyl-phosphate GlcNAc-1-phosphate transferase